jgi:phytoene synthase
MVSPLHFRIFRRGSTTYFYSTLFFPRQVREDVFVLYSFVRVADDYVDAVPQEADRFYAFRDLYRRAMEGEETGDPVVDPFVGLVERTGIDPAWVEAFLRSMACDLTKGRYETVRDLETYLYGSSEVVGLMMARVMGLPDAALPSARLLGKAMQYINFIRDIPEDLALGRTYLPVEEAAAVGLRSLEYRDAAASPRAFGAFIAAQVGRYLAWQEEAEAGFQYIPRRSLVPVKTASDLYRWTALQILADPFVVYRRKVKPSPPRAVARAVVNAVLPISRP